MLYSEYKIWDEEWNKEYDEEMWPVATPSFPEHDLPVHKESSERSATISRLAESVTRSLALRAKTYEM